MHPTEVRHQPDPSDAITIRPLTRRDFPLLQTWLNAAHVRRWWGITSAQIEAKYGPCIDATAPTQVCIIEIHHRPIGIIQSYRHADHPHWDNAIRIPAAAGIDYLIGEASYIGLGIGSAAIAIFTPRVFADYPDIDVIVAAPQADNVASRRALEKAGFTLVDERKLDSDDPSDAGPSAIYALNRPD
ncbi:GNAT family N-acetyltransferase [Dactylosporangium darangshiense]|uniref:GNAT family N-acetyltransferase n=1 Tax=Dactylosporangium darangshiense TaxID=579108 RepID=A0ABP8DHS2_9ACTN